MATNDQPRRITANQLVAFNVARWRKAAGLSQAGLGGRLGWSNRAVSAAERSQDEGSRPREFDAGTLLALAAALDLPLAALFLPPPGPHVLDAPGPGLDGAGMGAVFAYLFPDPGTGDDPLTAAYREAFTAAVGEYMDPARGQDLLRYLDEMTTAQRRAELLDRLAWQAEALRSVLGDIDEMRDAISKEKDAG